MVQYEYKVIPAPSKGQKGGDLKGAEGRFVYAIETTLNERALEGWEYVRAELLPSDERQGLTSTKTVYRTLLIFRRPLSDTRTETVVEKTEQTSAKTETDEKPAVTETPKQDTPVNNGELQSRKDHQNARPALRAERDAKAADTKQPSAQNEPKPGGGFLDDDDDKPSLKEERSASGQQAVFLRSDRKTSE